MIIFALSHPTVNPEYTRFLASYFDLDDSGQKTRDGWRVNTTFQFKNPAINTRHSVQHLKNHAEGRATLSNATKFRWMDFDGLGRPHAVEWPVRPDIDTHQGQDDLDRAVDIVRRVIGEELAYEKSDRGGSLYFIARRDITYDKRGYASITKFKICRQMDRVERLIQGIFRDSGIKATFELKGRPERGRGIHYRRGDQIRLPKPQSVGKILSSKVKWESVVRMLSCEPDPVQTPFRRATRRSDLDKHGKRVQCCGIVNRSHSIDRIREANRIYTERGYATGETDDERLDAFRRIFKWMDKQSNGSGRTGAYFTQDHLDIAIRLISKRLKKPNGSPVVYRLAIALCTLLKHSLDQGGECPREAVMGMLHHFKHHVNVQTAGRIINRLRKLGLIKLVNGTWGPGQCRVWEETKATRVLMLSMGPRPLGSGATPPNMLTDEKNKVKLGMDSELSGGVALWSVNPTSEAAIQQIRVTPACFSERVA